MQKENVEDTSSVWNFILCFKDNNFYYVCWNLVPYIVTLKLPYFEKETEYYASF